jgi:hypothetical protein
MDRIEKIRATKNRRLQKLYGITIRDYEERLFEQGGHCSICGVLPGTRALAVDHDHKWKYLKVYFPHLAHKDRWVICAPVVGSDSPYYPIRATALTKAEARAALKHLLKRASVRGLLCFSCNSGLRKYRDNPEFFDRAAAYLRHHQKKGAA